MLKFNANYATECILLKFISNVYLIIHIGSTIREIKEQQPKG